MKKIAKHLFSVCIFVIVLIPESTVIAQNSIILDEINDAFQTYSQSFHEERLYLHVDKPFLQPGETLWFAGYLQSGSELQPSEISRVVHVRLNDGKGETVKELKLLNHNGKLTGDITLDEKVDPGEYTLEAYTRWQMNGKNPYLFRKDIRIEQLVKPRVMADIAFDKPVYSGGDALSATIHLMNGSKKSITSMEGEGQLWIAGKLESSTPFISDDSGQFLIKFELPDFLTAEDILIKLIFVYNNLREEIAHAVPYNCGQVMFRFFPEGGDLVEGFISRVAFSVRDKNGRAIETRGLILDDQGNRVAEFESFHQGMGVFELKPEPDRDYRAIITSPTGIPGSFRLPVAMDMGMVLRVDPAANKKTKVTVQSDRQERAFLVVSMKDILCYSAMVQLRAGENVFLVDLSDHPAGVARITLFDKTSVPRGERILFANREKQLHIDIKADQQEYKSGEEVKLDLQFSDDSGLPVQGSYSIAVVDDHLLKASHSENSSILNGLLLQPEIKGVLTDVTGLFDLHDPDSEQALDLVMMTHGWRHFTWKEVLSEDIPMVTYKPEKAVVEGYVYDDTVLNRVKNLKIRVDGMDWKVKTRKDGYFRFEGLDLSEAVKLVYKDIHGNTSSYLLTEYTDSLMIDIAKTYDFKVGETHILKTENNAQYMASGSSAIKGRIVDAQTGEPMPFANLSAEVNGRMINGTTTDEDGYYTLKPLPPGRIDIRTTYMGYSPYTIRGVLTRSRQIIFLDIEMEQHVAIIEDMNIEEGPEDAATSRVQVLLENPTEQILTPLDTDEGYFKDPDNVEATLVQTSRKTRVEEELDTYVLPEVEIIYKEPLVPIDETITGRTMPKEEFDRLPRRTAEGAANTVGGVFSMDGEVGNVRGARGDQTVYYVDGVRVIGDHNVPPLGIAEISVFLGGLPAEYGDCRGGVIEITTRGPDMFIQPDQRQKKRQIINLSQLPVYYRAREFADFTSVEDETNTMGDYRSTLYWNGDLRPDEKGHATLSFFTSDAITDFRITVEGVSDRGEAGHAEMTIGTR